METNLCKLFVLLVVFREKCSSCDDFDVFFLIIQIIIINACACSHSPGKDMQIKLLVKNAKLFSPFSLRILNRNMWIRSFNILRNCNLSFSTTWNENDISIDWRDSMWRGFIVIMSKIEHNADCRVWKYWSSLSVNHMNLLIRQNKYLNSRWVQNITNKCNGHISVGYRCRGDYISNVPFK